MSGFVERWTALSHAQSPMSPDVFHKVMGLFTLSAIIGRNCYMELGPRTIYPNIWVLLVGASGVTKKTTSLNFAMDALEHTASEMRMADSSSVEGFVAELADKSENGVCQVWSIKDEFGGLLSAMKSKDYLSDMKDILMQLFDGRSSITRRLHKMHYKIDPVYFCLAAATTGERLEQILGPEDVSDGFFPRFLGVHADNNVWSPAPQMTLAWKTERADLEAILTKLRTVYQAYTTECTLTKDATQYFHDWSRGLEAELITEGYSGAVISRLEDYFLKLAMLYEISDKCDFLGDKVAIDGYRLIQVEGEINSIIERNKRLYGLLGNNADIEHIYRIIESFKEFGCSYKEGLRRSHLTIRKFATLVDTLTASGRVSYAATDRGLRYISTEYYKGPEGLIRNV